MQSQKAFTLVEIVLALGVAALAIVGIMALLPAGLDSGRAAQAETTASTVAQRILEEEFLGRTYNAVVSEHGSHALPYVLLPGEYDSEENCEVLLVGFRVVPASRRNPVLELIEVTIAVGMPRHVPGLPDEIVPPERRTWETFTTYLAKRGN